MANEVRLIDANALKERAIRVSTVKEHCYMKAVGTREIDKAPTIDPESLRPKGRWVKDGDFLICLNCESEINVKNNLGVENRKNYCPNCGAKMEN